jgi:hypothetical protein
MEQIRKDKQWRKDLILSVSSGLSLDFNSLTLSSIQEFLTFTRKWAAGVKDAQENKARNGRRHTG